MWRTKTAWRSFRRLQESGELRLRVLFHPPVASLPALIQRGARSGAGTPWLGLGGVKLFLDGSLGSRTAWMLEPYEGSRDRGMPVVGEREADEAMRAAAANGIAVTVHAIGDAAVRRALDLIERLPRVALPHRIEHLQCVHPADLARAARARVVASMQPAHLLTDIPLVDRHWGRLRQRRPRGHDRPAGRRVRRPGAEGLRRSPPERLAAGGEDRLPGCGPRVHPRSRPRLGDVGPAGYAPAGRCSPSWAGGS
ncbi:MAG: amidohydrolase family protein [Gemmatimonadales bacterium]|nr:amidohydrolase family protein [Gemmatimonadales bacterium]